MNGPHGSEMSTVEGGDLRLGEPFRERHDARIDDADREIAICGLQLPTAREVARTWRLDDVDARQHVVEECEPGVGRQSTAAPVVELGEDQRWNDQILCGRNEQICAGRVIRIRGVKRSKERPRVQDQRHSAWLFRNRIRGQFRCAPTIRRAGDADSRPSRRPNCICLLLDGIAEDGGQRYASTESLGFERAESFFGGADGRATQSIHDARC